MEGREGTFSSSSIYKLVELGSRPMTKEELKAWKEKYPKSQAKNTKDGFSKSGLTYIKEKSYEIRLGQALEAEQYSKITSWGHVVEPYAYAQIPNEVLSLSSRLESKSRRKHPELLWTGASDFETKDTIGDIKCPFTLKSFCEQVDIYEAVKNGDLERFKKEKPEYYWQLVSNSILATKVFAMAVCFVPSEDDVLEILSESNLEYDANDSDHLTKCKEKVKWLTLIETPHLRKESPYDNLNFVKFEVPQKDKDFLTERVKLAEAELRKLLK